MQENAKVNAPVIYAHYFIEHKCNTAVLQTSKEKLQVCISMVWDHICNGACESPNFEGRLRVLGASTRGCSTTRATSTSSAVTTAISSESATSPIPISTTTATATALSPARSLNFMEAIVGVSWSCSCLLKVC